MHRFVSARIQFNVLSLEEIFESLNHQEDLMNINIQDPENPCTAAWSIVMGCPVSFMSFHLMELEMKLHKYPAVSIV